MPKALTQEEFIKRSKAIHGDKYDYSVSIYTGVDKHLDVICPVHGKFPITPNKHFIGQGCKKCFEESLKSYNTQTFIEELKSIYGDKYDYSLVEYKSKKSLVTLICPIHEDFELRADTLLTSKIGCRDCYNDSLRKDTEYFIKKSRAVHGDKYDYSCSVYIGSEDKLDIRCPIHNYVFSMTPYNHYQGKGCRLCAIDANKERLRLTQEEFIQKAVEVHGDLYSYDKVVYERFDKEVQIFCKKCNEYFPHLPTYHLSGYGHKACCLNSGKSKAELALLDWIKENIDEEASSIYPSFLEGKELDIFIPKYNLAIEYNGSYWHSDKMLHDTYHLDKFNACKQNDINLIHIFDFEDLEEWKRLLLEYVKDVYSFEVQFENTKRIYKNKCCYGKSKIIRKQNHQKR